MMPSRRPSRQFPPIKLRQANEKKSLGLRAFNQFLESLDSERLIPNAESRVKLEGITNIFSKESEDFVKTIDIGVRRSSARNAYAAFIEMGTRLDEGQIPLIFPEGSIPKSSPVLGNFKIGAFRLAIEKKVPIVPVSMIDNSTRFPDKKPIIARPGKMRVTIHRPIPTENLNVEDAEQLKQKVFTIIEAELKKHHSNYEN